VSDHPFTTDEIYAALRLIGVPEAEARQSAFEAVNPQAPPYEKSPEDMQPGELRFSNAPFVQFFGDFLAILSLISPSTNAKVQKYRASNRQESDSAEERQWQLRREELRQALGKGN
jgi:hypothetical protein